MIPGEIITVAGDIVLNEGAVPVTIEVANTGDRPIQIGSHYHFAETNPALAFDREVALVPLGGVRKVHGFNGKVMGVF